MAFLGAVLALAVFLAATLAGSLLALRFLLSLWPGALAVSLRRRLFLLTQPWLDPLEAWFSLRTGGVEWAPLGAACACFLVARFLAPWFLLLGLRASGG